MPCMFVHTNVAVDDAAGVLKRCSAEIAALLGKPESYVMVKLADSQQMCFGGSDAPLAFVELTSLGLGSDRTAGISAGICALLEELLGVERARIYIAFAAPERAMFGWNGGTF